MKSSASDLTEPRQVSLVEAEELLAIEVVHAQHECREARTQTIAHLVDCDVNVFQRLLQIGVEPEQIDQPQPSLRSSRQRLEDTTMEVLFVTVDATTMLMKPHV